MFDFRPQPGNLDEYRDVLERLNASVAFKAMGDYRDPVSIYNFRVTAHAHARAHPIKARLFETGVKKLSQLYTKLVAEGSSGSPPNGPEFQFQPFPSDLFTELHPLVEFLRTLPLPPTHPSHPAASAIQNTLREAQKGYADMRGSWCLKCLEMYAKRVVERSETLDGVLAGRELGKWVDDLLYTAEVRRPI